MLVNHDSRISGNVSGNFLFSFLIDKTSKATHINIVASSHIGFYDCEECFYRCSNIRLVNTSLLSYLVDNVCFGNNFFQKGCKVIRSFLKRKMNLLIIIHMSHNSFYAR